MSPMEILRTAYPQMAELEARTLLVRAEGFILDYCQREDVPDGAAAVQTEIALMFAARAGAEGSASRREGPVYETFVDLPEAIARRLNRYRKIGYVRR